MGLGLETIVGLSDYQLTNGDTSSIERSYPFSAKVNMVFNPIAGLLFSIGPGVEFEQHKNIFLVNFSVGYKI